MLARGTSFAGYCTVLASRGVGLTAVPSGIQVLPHRGPAAAFTLGGERTGLLGLYVPCRGPKERRNEDKRAFQRAVTADTGSEAAVFRDVKNAVGEMAAVNQDTGTVVWDTPLPSSPYGAATVTNDVVLTTTFHGDLYALDATTGAILFKTPLSAGSNAPVAVDGDYVIAGAGAALSSRQRDMIIAYKLGAIGKLPDTAGS